MNANSNTAPRRGRRPLPAHLRHFGDLLRRVCPGLPQFLRIQQQRESGVACGLQNIQKIKDGESLGGKAKAEEDFNDGYQSDAGDDFLA